MTALKIALLLLSLSLVAFGAAVIVTADLMNQATAVMTTARERAE